MLENVYEGLNARPKVYLSKEYFCEMYPTCVSSKLCEFITNVYTVLSYQVCTIVFAAKDADEWSAHKARVAAKWSESRGAQIHWVATMCAQILVLVRGDNLGNSAFNSRK